MNEIYSKGNYIFIKNGDSSNWYTQDQIQFREDSISFVLSIKESVYIREDILTILFADVANWQDQSSTSYTESTLRDFLEQKTGFNSPTGGSVGNLYRVVDIYDLPESVGGVITLQDNTAYHILNSNLDLNGSRLVGGNNTALLGSSSETSKITSTGLSIGVPIFTSVYTTPMANLTFQNVDTGVDIDGLGNNAAIDWTAVNFTNIPNAFTIKDVDNFIYDKSAVTNSNGIIFDGTIGTIGIGNSIFTTDGAAVNMTTVLSTATIQRRFRIQYSSLVIFGSGLGINVDASATMPNESFILDTVNFSGGGSYLTGIDESDNKSLFINCVGIENSSDISQYFMNNNATATIISATGTPVKIIGTTTSAAVTRKFTNTDNRATYNGALSRFFRVVVTASVESGNNNQVGIYIAKNGVTIDESEVYGTTSGSGRVENIVCQTLVRLEANDYIEVFCENNTATQDITATNLNVVID